MRFLIFLHCSLCPDYVSWSTSQSCKLAVRLAKGLLSLVGRLDLPVDLSEHIDATSSESVGYHDCGQVQGLMFCLDALRHTTATVVAESEMRRKHDESFRVLFHLKNIDDELTAARSVSSESVASIGSKFLKEMEAAVMIEVDLVKTTVCRYGAVYLGHLYTFGKRLSRFCILRCNQVQRARVCHRHESGLVHGVPAQLPQHCPMGECHAASEALQRARRAVLLWSCCGVMCLETLDNAAEVCCALTLGASEAERKCAASCIAASTKNRKDALKLKDRKTSPCL